MPVVQVPIRNQYVYRGCALHMVYPGQQRGGQQLIVVIEKTEIVFMDVLSTEMTRSRDIGLPSAQHNDSWIGAKALDDRLVHPGAVYDYDQPGVYVALGEHALGRTLQKPLSFGCT